MVNACGFAFEQKDQLTRGYTSVCVMHETTDDQNMKKNYDFRTECLPNSILNGLGPGDAIGNTAADYSIWECGCCDGILVGTGKTAELNYIQDEPYCSAPICSPEDNAWEPCNVENGTVKGIKLCVFDGGHGFEEKCVDPFYVPQTSDNLVVCGSFRAWFSKQSNVL